MMHSLKDGMDLLVKVYHKRNYIQENKAPELTLLDDFYYRFYAGQIIATNTLQSDRIIVTISRSKKKYKNSGIDVYNKITDQYHPSSTFYRTKNNVHYQFGADHVFDFDSTEDDHFNATIQDNMYYSLDDIKDALKNSVQIRSLCNIFLNSKQHI